jgi:CheY-like chemotaxis protein
MATLRRLFCLALKLEGFGVLEAADGFEALLKLESHQVMLDLSAPSRRSHRSAGNRGAGGARGNPSRDCDVFRRPVAPPRCARASEADSRI